MDGMDARWARNGFCPCRLTPLGGGVSGRFRCSMWRCREADDDDAAVCGTDTPYRSRPGRGSLGDT